MYFVFNVCYIPLSSKSSAEESHFFRKKLNPGRGGLYFIPKNVTMRGDSYLRVLDHHMLLFWNIRRCNHFMQNGDPVHRSRVVKKWLKDNHVPVLECPRNSPDLNPIENAWN